MFGVGFGTAYPVYVGYVMQGVDADRRGAAFGAILAAFDTGIGTGSTSMGYLIQHYGFATAFGIAAALSALALPYFLTADRLMQRGSHADVDGGGDGGTGSTRRTEANGGRTKRPDVVRGSASAIGRVAGRRPASRVERIALSEERAH